ncbi:hypothetical protein [Anaerosinus massiliensis]|uniref:hypothetical protein n=1 Tax=Massilibacillus massiliensis TaxID=1806837 RepID=UPI000DA60F05|nr:hypothetical protein [Massilibacillus massiliensis]
MKKITLLITLLLMPLLSCTAFASDNWQWVGSNSNVIVYVDDDSIKYSTPQENPESIDKNIITFSSKDKYSEEGIQLFVNNMNKQNNHLAEWDKLSYIIMIKSINVKDNKFYPIKYSYYDSQGRLIYDWNCIKNTPWKEIKPNTFEESCYNHVITFAREHIDGFQQISSNKLNEK